MSRPRAETMPAVTVPPRPNGLPTASAQSPTRPGSVGELHEVEQLMLAEGLILSSATSVRGSVPTSSASSFFLVVEADLILVGAVDDVVVGDDIAVSRDDEARALSLRRLLPLRHVLELFRQVLEELVERAVLGNIREAFRQLVVAALEATLAPPPETTEMLTTDGFTLSMMSAKLSGARPNGVSTVCAAS